MDMDRMVALAFLADFGAVTYRGVEINRSRVWGWDLKDVETGKVTVTNDALFALHLVDLLRDKGIDWFEEAA
ncbi:hypothetical protein LY05_00309 [Oceanicella actignis]|nr:hypothetical protein LY05_00309 [Oceanicella actignis]